MSAGKKEGELEESRLLSLSTPPASSRIYNVEHLRPLLSMQASSSARFVATPAPVTHSCCPPRSAAARLHSSKLDFSQAR